MYKLVASYASKLLIGSLFSSVLVLAADVNTHTVAPFADNKMLERLKKNYNQKAERRGIALNKLISSLQYSTIDKQLVEVNRFFNTFRYITDDVLWKKKDYWATPEEFLGMNSGDCEDYVIAKYFTLLNLGVPNDRLFLTYVKAKRQNVAHMVLSYFPTKSSIPLILDNYNKRILRADKRRDLLPVYSFNAKSLFLTNASAGLGRALPNNKIKNNKWEKLLNTIQGSKKP